MGTADQKDIILTVCAHNNKVSKYMKGNLIEVKIICGDFNIPLYLVKRTNKHNINENIEELNKTINQLELNDVY